MLPTLIIDCTTIFNGPDLMPLRFPFATLFPLLGIVLGLIIETKRKSVILISLITVILVLFFSQNYFIPNVILYMDKNNAAEVYPKELITNFDFKTIDNSVVRLNDTLQSKCSLLEFFFVGCKPCEVKLNALKKIKDSANSKQFHIYLICNGLASSFDQFYDYEKKYNSSGFTFLYDYDTVIYKTINNANGYPMEFMLDKNKKIRSKYLSFGNEETQVYINKEVALIKEIINE